MRVVGLVEHPDHVCCRYRLAAFVSAFQDAGHQLELETIPRGLFARARLWWSVRHADAVILQRRLLAGLHLLMLRRHARRLIFDFDDAVYRRDSYSSKGSESSIRRRRFTAILHTADAVVAGNAFLRREAARFVDPRRIHVIPTCVEPQRYPLALHRRAGAGVQLVWIGSSSTLQGLERRQPLIDTVARQLPGLEFKVICDRFPQFKSMPIRAIGWSQASETEELATADIGVSWVPDDPWSLGKCGLKVLQYMAAGLPVVANPVGVQADMVRHGENGYLAETPAQWVEAIQRLARDPGLRQRMGRAGRRFVEQQFGAGQGVALWLQLLDRLVSPVRRAAA